MAAQLHQHVSLKKIKTNKKIVKIESQICWLRSTKSNLFFVDAYRYSRVWFFFGRSLGWFETVLRTRLECNQSDIFKLHLDIFEKKNEYERRHTPLESNKEYE